MTKRERRKVRALGNATRLLLGRHFSLWLFLTKACLPERPRHARHSQAPMPSMSNSDAQIELIAPHVQKYGHEYRRELRPAIRRTWVAPPVAPAGTIAALPTLAPRASNTSYGPAKSEI